MSEIKDDESNNNASAKNEGEVLLQKVFAHAKGIFSYKLEKKIQQPQLLSRNKNLNL